MEKKQFPTLNSESGCPSPVFPWSPLPIKKQFSGKKIVSNKSISTTEELYPNCDASIWLRSCDNEITEPISGECRGVIPRWLNGSLIRNGPGSIKAGHDVFRHLFDGSALLHRFGIKEGRVTYQCRFLQSETYKKICSAKRLIVTEFGTKAVPDPCHTIFDRVSSLFDFKSDMSDNAMISVYPFDDELYAFNEIPIIHKINPKTLETEGRLDVSETVNIVNHTSHPHVTSDGSVYNMGISMHATGPYYNVIYFPNNDFSSGSKSHKSMAKNAKIVASIPARWPLNPSYMHTFGITENYYIILEQPLSISIPDAITQKILKEPTASCLRWYHDQSTQINVVSRHTGKLEYTFLANTLFFLHIVNQYEHSQHIVLDICAYRDPSMIDCMYIESLRHMQQNPDYAKMFRGRPIRFVLPLNPEPYELCGTDKNLVTLHGTRAKAFYLENGDILAKGEKLCNLGCETPRINYENYLGKKYRYFYAISSDVDAENPGTIIKVDTSTKTCKTWCEPNCFPSEPVFVPTPTAKSEDDGVILSAMIWGKEDTNHVGLLVLNAKTFEEIGRAEFETKGPVPKCLHGWFVPDRN